MVNTFVTRLDNHVATLEARQKLTNPDCATIHLLLKRSETLDGKFKTHHFIVVDFIDEETLGEEQAVLDNHDNKILLLTQGLQCLMGDTGAVTPPKSATEPYQFLGRRLCHLEKTPRSINLTVEPLAPGPYLDNCLVRQLEKQVGRLRTELSDITSGIV